MDKQERHFVLTDLMDEARPLRGGAQFVENELLHALRVDPAVVLTQTAERLLTQARHLIWRLVEDPLHDIFPDRGGSAFLKAADAQITRIKDAVASAPLPVTPAFGMMGEALDTACREWLEPVDGTPYARIREKA